MGCCTSTPPEQKGKSNIDPSEQQQLVQKTGQQHIVANTSDDERRASSQKSIAIEDRIKIPQSKFATEDQKTVENGAEATVEQEINNKEIIKKLINAAPAQKAADLKNYKSGTDPLHDMVSTENIRYIIFELIKSHNKPNDTVTDAEIRKTLRKWKENMDNLYIKLLEEYDEKQNIEQIEIDKALKVYRLVDDYRLGKKLGRGAYAVVKLAERKSDKMKFAAKVINKRGLNKWDLRGLRLEIAIMRDLEHANIVRLFDVFESPSKIGLIIGLLRGGELLDVVIDKGSFSEHEASQCFAQLCSGLGYIHSKGIAHRDVKPDNLLFATKIRDWSAIPKDSLKLVDFGLAERLRKSKGLTEYCGTPIYMAPEIFDHKPYDYMVDMWSAGCILYALLVGYPPFDFDDDHDISKLSQSVRNDTIDFDPEYWGEVSDDAKDLILRLLERNPKKRFTAQQALGHKWMKSASKELFDAQRMDRLKMFTNVRKMKRGVTAMLAVIRLIEILEQLKLRPVNETVENNENDVENKENDVDEDVVDKKEADNIDNEANEANAAVTVKNVDDDKKEVDNEEKEAITVENVEKKDVEANEAVIVENVDKQEVDNVDNVEKKKEDKEDDSNSNKVNEDENKAPDINVVDILNEVDNEADNEVNEANKTQSDEANDEVEDGRAGFLGGADGDDDSNDSEPDKIVVKGDDDDSD